MTIAVPVVSSICAAVNQINRGTHGVLKMRPTSTILADFLDNQFLWSAQRDLKGYLCHSVVIQLVGLFCLGVSVRNLMLRGIMFQKGDVLLNRWFGI